MSLTDRQRAYGRGRIFRKRRKDGTEYGNFILAYYVGGRKREESSRTIDAQKATRLLNERIGTIGAGRAPAPGMHRVTIAELLDDLEALYEGEQRPSLRTLRGHIAALTPMLGVVRAADLTTKKLLRFVAAQRSTQAAEATIGRRLDTLHRALTLGQDATPPKVAMVPKFPQIDESANVRKLFATRAQAETILERLRMRDADLADTVEWAYVTGMRKGAVAGLGWDLFDHETWTLRLPPPGRKKRTPKAIPLRPGSRLRAIIERRWARRNERARETGRIEPLIFWRIYRGSPRLGLRSGDAVRVYEYRKAFKRAAVAAGAPALIPHDFRRTACRNAWEATHDRRKAMLLSGHATESMFDRYNIDSGEHLSETLDKIEAYIESQLPTATRVVPTLPRRRTRRRRTAS
jgi:integrase